MNRVLRRLVHDEETADRERRLRLQQIMKQRNAEALAATAAGGSSNPEAESSKAGGHVVRSAGDDESEDSVEQQKLLASPRAHWYCLEDSQQSMCIALNRRQTLFAVGEKDGRLSIWDNTTIRVISRELDPTLIVLPDDSAIANNTSAGASAPGSPLAKRRKIEELEDSVDGDSAGNDDASVDDESVTNDEGSIEADDDDGEDDDPEDDASVEESASVDGDQVDEQLADADDDTEGDAEISAPPTDDDTVMIDSMPPARSERQNSSDLEGQLTLEALKIAKTALKHVLSFNCLSAHPSNPNVVLVCSYNALPVIVNVRTGDRSTLHLQHHQDFHVERHFGLGQSVLEPLKSAIKRPSNGSSKKKKKKSTDASNRSKSSSSSSSKKRRR
ncbi:hypothetical protein ATCC90586_004741 [Pythium insidiosum]|nr:hypothetical protein ATCC90586_004741 [Pythium insidiosum]